MIFVRIIGWILLLAGIPEEYTVDQLETYVHRQGGIGSRLFEAICARMRANGMATVRTMLARDDALNMAFFRSQGMMGGSFIQLEMPLELPFD